MAEGARTKQELENASTCSSSTLATNQSICLSQQLGLHLNSGLKHQFPWCHRFLEQWFSHVHPMTRGH